MPRVSQKTKACRALQLSDRFEPLVRISHLLKINLDETIACLRTSQSEEAHVICALYDRLSPEIRVSINIDYLIAAAHCKDIHKIFGLVCESYSRVKAMETQMIAAGESPAVMKSVTRFAKERKGFNHAKLLLQTTGVAPVPKNQVNYNIGNKVDNSQQVNFNVSSHSEVASTMRDVMRELAPPEETLVPSSARSREKSGDREEDEEEAD